MTATQMKMAIETLVDLEKQITRMVTLRPGHKIDPKRIADLCEKAASLTREIHDNIDLMYQGAEDPSDNWNFEPVDATLFSPPVGDHCSYCGVDLTQIPMEQVFDHKDGGCETSISDDEMEAFYETVENARSIDDVCPGLTAEIMDKIDARHN